MGKIDQSYPDFVQDSFINSHRSSSHRGLSISFPKVSVSAVSGPSTTTSIDNFFQELCDTLKKIHAWLSFNWHHVTLDAPKIHYDAKQHEQKWKRLDQFLLFITLCVISLVHCIDFRCSWSSSSSVRWIWSNWSLDKKEKGRKKEELLKIHNFTKILPLAFLHSTNINNMESKNKHNVL